MTVSQSFRSFESGPKRGTGVKKRDSLFEESSPTSTPPPMRVTRKSLVKFVVEEGWETD